MSLMDDVFDLQDFVKNDPGMKEAFDHVVTALWGFESERDAAQKDLRHLREWLASGPFLMKPPPQGEENEG